MNLCEYADHKWSMYIEEGKAYLKCEDKHSDEEIEKMLKANDGMEPACAMIDYIDALDIFVYDIPISLNRYWVPGSYECPQDGEPVTDIRVLGPSADPQY